MLEQHQPDALLLLGDTNSCLAAIAAKRRKIPIFHMEAGNRCFDFRVPEEINRRIVDHIADINLTYSEIAREYLLREGLPPDQVIKTGSPMREVLEHYRAGIEASDVLERLGSTQARLLPRQRAPRRERRFPGASSAQLFDVLDALAETLRRAGHRLDPPAHAQAHGGAAAASAPAGVRFSSRSAFSTTSSCRRTRGPCCPTAARSPKSPRS